METTVTVSRNLIQFEQFADGGDVKERARVWSREVTRQLWDAGFSAASGGKIEYGVDGGKLCVRAKVDDVWFWRKDEPEPVCFPALNERIDFDDDDYDGLSADEILAEARRALLAGYAADRGGWAAVENFDNDVKEAERTCE